MSCERTSAPPTRLLEWRIRFPSVPTHYVVKSTLLLIFYLATADKNEENSLSNNSTVLMMSKTEAEFPMHEMNKEILTGGGGGLEGLKCHYLIFECSLILHI